MSGNPFAGDMTYASIFETIAEPRNCGNKLQNSSDLPFAAQTVTLRCPWETGATGATDTNFLPTKEDSSFIEALVDFITRGVDANIVLI